jgi:PBSX family phage terminase large subunit
VDSRSGKTFIAVYALVVRAGKHPNTDHLIIRKHNNHIKASIWNQTLPKVLKICFPALSYTLKEQDMTLVLSNGSTITMAGSDNKERIEKILGTEWATIYLNEVSQLGYDIYEMFKTRLNPPNGVKPLFLLDQNPPKKSHWTFIKFHTQINPENLQPLSDADKQRQTFIQLNPKDNANNLSEGYIATLESLSESKKKRFLEGAYQDDTENALWKTEWITKNRIIEMPENTISLVVAVDPNVTADANVGAHTDMAGIITVASYFYENDIHYAVKRDDSTDGLSWGKVACDVYAIEMADKVIAENNQGGDLVEAHIRNYNRNISYQGVRATRGKELRAEPIADLYRRGLVHHMPDLYDLEDELTSWVPGEGRSPNRLDALVWAITYLMGNHSAEACISFSM